MNIQIMDEAYLRIKIVALLKFKAKISPYIYLSFKKFGVKIDAH